MSKSCRTYTLDQAMQLYCHLQGNDNMRGLKGLMVKAKLVWGEIFNNTLWNYTSEWLPVQGGNPYPYIMLPDDISLFMGIYDEVQAHKGRNILVPLDFDNKISVLAKKVLKACSCTQSCNCGNNCETANSFVREEIEHEIDGDTYIENKWVETCKNGDVIEWREVPAKVYSQGIVTGEFDPQEFGSEFSVGETTYDVETVTLQRRICTLKTKPCGCIDESEYNATLLKDYCGVDTTIRNFMFENFCNTRRGKTVLRRDEENPLKIYIVGEIKDQYFLKSQRFGASENSLVPEYALRALWFGVQWYSDMLNPSTRNVAQASKFDYTGACKDVIKHLNPISQRALDNLQTTRKQM